MTKINVGPFNIITGQQTQISAAEWPSPDQTGFIVIANNSPVTLGVSTADGGEWLYPNTGNIFKPSGSNVSVQPITQPVNNVFVGTFTATYYSSDEPLPAGYPSQLPTLSQANSSVLAVLSAQMLIGSFTYTVQPPPGSGSLVITSNSQLSSLNLITIRGVQTGKLYVNGIFNIPPNFTFSTVGIVDTSFQIQFAGFSGTQTVTIFALPAPPPLVNRESILYGVSIPPSSLAGDHPPNELTNLGFYHAVGDTLLSAPGVGLRYRIFYCQTSLTDAPATNGQIILADSFVAILRLSGNNVPAVSTIDARPSGFPMSTNLAVQVVQVTGSGFNICGQILFTVENV